MSYLNRHPIPQTEQRKIALGAARSQLRNQGILPRTASFDQAWNALDVLYKLDNTTVAAQWYINASEPQIRLFRKEWKNQ